MQSAHGTLTANSETVEAFTVADADTINVHLVAGTDPIYFRLDGTAATVAGAGCYVLHAGLAGRAVRIPTSSAQSVSLISAGTSSYAVEVLD